MKKILLTIMCVAYLGVSAQNLNQADSIWSAIGAETVRGANTATRIGSAGNYIVAGVRDTLANFATSTEINDTLSAYKKDSTWASIKVNSLISKNYNRPIISSVFGLFPYYSILDPLGNMTFMSAAFATVVASSNTDLVLKEDSLRIDVDGEVVIASTADTIYPYKPIKGYFTAAQISDSLAQITGYQNIEGTKNFTKILADTIGVSDYLSSHEITTSILGADAINSSEISTYEIETAKIKVNDTITSAFYSVSELNEAPASATAEGKTGEIRITAGFIYVCVSDDVWVRATLATW